ncbi:hypothetical protein EII41_02570 [Tannerella forsythia]|uniref:Uncharacterized protein n=1 Tax=Tannerella forsythia TaxID=28112 RepID=A0A3P1Z4P1_TANFO|nr:hypothetical protein EII41_02570 [Tannerella forsythia]
MKKSGRRSQQILRKNQKKLTSLFWNLTSLFFESCFVVVKTNRQYDQNQDNRGKQLNPNRNRLINRQ